MSNSEFDVLIIGSGPGGYTAAIRAAQLGFRTAVVERDHLGGICLNWGCIPTKALLRSAEILHVINNAHKFGIVVSKPGIDLSAVVDRSRRVSSQLNAGVEYLLQKNNVRIIWGEAKIDAPGKVTVSESERRPKPKNALGAGSYFAKHIIIATGARPRTLSEVSASKKHVWSYFEAMKPSELPASLLIVGSGAIGVEFASFYRSLGSEVTVIETLDQILPSEDKEISSLAKTQLENRGIRFLTTSKVAQLSESAGSVKAVIKDQAGNTTELNANKAILAVGVVGNVENLGLEKIGVRTEYGRILADSDGRTNVAGIYAIGDVAGQPMLAHKAEHEGIHCVEAIRGMDRQSNKSIIPSCIYSSPQIASVGLTEETALQKKRDVRIGRFHFKASGKAVALGETEGLIKVIFDKQSGELLGAHMIGPEVTELIQGYLIAMKLETTEQELFETIFPHPTLSEMMKEAALQAYGRSMNS